MNHRAGLAALAALLVLQVLGAGAAAGDPTVAATRRCLNMCLPNQKACGSECVLRTTPCEEAPTTACDAPPSPAFCNAVPARGKCDGSVTRWYHHLAEDRCKQFEWGGCEEGSNDNRFESEEACARRCPTGNKVEKESPDTDVEVGAGATGMQEPVEEVTAADLSGAAAGTPASEDDDGSGSSSSSSSSSGEAPAPAPAKPQAESQRPKPAPVPAGDGDRAVGYGEHVKDVAGYGLDQHAQPPKPSAEEQRAAAERQKLEAEQQRRADEQAKQEALAREKASKTAKKETEVEPTTGPVKLAQQAVAEKRAADAKAKAEAEAEAAAAAAAAEKKRQEELARKEFVAVPVVSPPAQKGNAPKTAPPTPQKASLSQVRQAARVSETEAQVKKDMQDALLRERERAAAAKAESVQEAAAKAAAADKAENERLARLKAERKHASEERRKTKEESLKSQCRCERKRARCQSACAPAAPCPCAAQRCNCPVTRQHHEQHEAAKKEAPLQCNGKLAGPKVTALLDAAPGAAAAGKATHRDRACAGEQRAQSAPKPPAAGKTTCFGRLLCPFDNAVCCDDQATCCPATYRCVASDAGATKCVPPGAAA